MPIPRMPLILTWAGMLPFLFAAGLHLSPPPEVAEGSYALLYPTDGVPMLASYGLIILCFMSGVLWGFAAQQHRQDPLPFVLSVLPAIAAFFLASTHIFGAPSNRDALMWLTLGFPAVFALDIWFWRQGMTPPWWLKLRVPPTLVATLCCGIGWLT